MVVFGGAPEQPADDGEDNERPAEHDRNEERQREVSTVADWSHVLSLDPPLARRRRCVRAFAGALRASCLPRVSALQP